MATTNQTVNYDDKRFAQVDREKETAVSTVKNTYDEMISQSDQYFDDQIQASKDWTKQQQQAQQDRTDFTIEQIEQQKEKATTDYKKEQSGAYVDWQKQSNQYGANAEQRAASGMTQTGYSESSQVGMYNAYQNRVAVARQAYDSAIQNYNNGIKDAQLQNSSALATIAYQGLQTQLGLALQGFQNKNQLIVDKQNAVQTTEDRYYTRWQDVLSQINQENAFAEQVRQYNQNYALQQQQMAEDKRQYDKSYELSVNQYNEGVRQFNEEMDRLKEKDKKDEAYRTKMLAQQSTNSDTAVISKTSNSAETGSKVTSQTGVSPSNQSTKAALLGYQGPITGSSDKKYSGNVTNSKYWNKEYNSDCNVFGTFSNGYQPKGISGYGEVEKTSEKIDVEGVTLTGEKTVVRQNVWKTSDGSKWYWNGMQNKYVMIPAKGSAKANSGRNTVAMM